MSAKSNNPVFKNITRPPIIDGPAMTLDDVVMKMVLCMAVLLVGAVLGWAIPALILPGVLIGFGLAMANIFKKNISPALVLVYAGFEGLALGGLSGVLEHQYRGIAVQAVLATLTVAGVTLILYKNRVVRTSPKLTRIVLIAMLGYLVFSLLNMVLAMSGIISSPFGVHSMVIPGTSIPIGLILGLFAVAMAAYCLVMDFESIEDSIQRGAPAKEAWRGAFGLLVTLVWMYTEILRLLALLRE